MRQFPRNARPRLHLRPTQVSTALSAGFEWINDHIATLAALGALATLLFGGALSILHQHLYGGLGVRPYEVGLDRNRLIVDTLGGVLLISLFVGVLFAVLLVSVLVGPIHRRARALRIGLGLVALTTLLVVAVFTWQEAGRAAAAVRDGTQYSGRLGPGLYLLDFDSTPFRFTKLPARHSFDRGCLLYLGQHDDKLVMYDVKERQPLRLPKDEYDGEALGWGSDELPERCLSDRDTDDRKLAIGNPIGDVDAGGDTIIWTERPAGATRWWLVARVDETTRLLTRSSAPPAPDLGRAGDGRLVITYRACSSRRACVLRQRDVRGTRSLRIRAPRRPGCAVSAGTRASRLVAVVLTGQRCGVEDRGVWVRPGRAGWTRVRGSGLASGEIDVLGRRLAWLERRGPVQRVRVLEGGELWTAATFPIAHHGFDPIGALRVTPRGALWTAQRRPRAAPVVVTYDVASGTCAPHGTLPAGPRDSARFAPWRSSTVTATGAEVRLLDRRVDLAAGDEAALKDPLLTSCSPRPVSRR